MAGNPAFGMAVKAVYDCFKHLKDGGDDQPDGCVYPDAGAETEVLAGWSRHNGTLRFPRAPLFGLLIKPTALHAAGDTIVS